MDVLERIRRQVSLVEELVRELEVERSHRGVERLVQLVIQALLDLGLMAVAALGRERPRERSEIGYTLRDLGVAGEDEARLLRSMAGLRNILVHAYATVDREKVLELAERLKADAPRIAAAALRGVERRPIHPPRESVEEAVERLRGALEGRVALAFLHGGESEGLRPQRGLRRSSAHGARVRPLQAWRAGGGRRRGCARPFQPPPRRPRQRQGRLL
uniref:DUF86 domain-containing protein n=1 Tax=Thermofilum pendens TaxID=2269 RepID=A0A7C1P4D1_THEPE